MRTRTVSLCVVLATFCASLSAQTPQPFPRPEAAAPAPRAPVPQGTRPPAPAPPAPSASAARAAEDGIPTEATLGLPIHPGAQFIASYDAGRGQRYYIFGSTTPFAELVLYYRGVLKERGNLVFEEPPTHTFEVGRFRDETMAFPPGVTIKDFTWGGSQGYPNPRRDPKPARFPTLIQIVPAPAAVTPPR